MSEATGRYDDAILRLATVILRIVILLSWVAIVLLAVVVPLGGLVWRETLVAQFAENGYGPQAFPAMLIVGIAAAGLLYLGIRFFSRLLALMRTVEQGDPFVPENAARLRAMAWLLLAIELLGFAIGMLARWAVGEAKGFEFSATGLIAILSLFVLARVFSRGTAMREEIEGTV